MKNAINKSAIQRAIDTMANERDVKRRLRGLMEDEQTAHIFQWFVLELSQRKETHAQTLDKVDPRDAVLVGQLISRRDEDEQIKSFFDKKTIQSRINILDTEIKSLQSRLKTEALQKTEASADHSGIALP
jgi:hypothetical protein